MEPIEDFAEPDEPGGPREVPVHWCPNLDCPSNHALRGLVRVGVNLYVCEVCGEQLSGPFSTYGGTATCTAEGLSERPDMPLTGLPNSVRFVTSSGILT